MARGWRIPLLAALSLLSLPAFAKGPTVAMAVNASDKICIPLRNVLQERPIYLTYDPEHETTLPLRLRRGHPGFLMRAARDNVFPVVWPNPLNLGVFNDRDPHGFSGFTRDGLGYDQDYTVSETAINVNDEYKPHRVFLRRNLGNNRIALDPLIFMPDDGSSLSTAFNQLRASDMVQYLAGSYPITRAPGKVTVYALRADGKPDDPARVFRAEVLCTFVAQ